MERGFDAIRDVSQGAFRERLGGVCDEIADADDDESSLGGCLLRVLRHLLAEFRDDRLFPRAQLLEGGWDLIRARDGALWVLLGVVRLRGGFHGDSRRLDEFVRESEHRLSRLALLRVVRDFLDNLGRRGDGGGGGRRLVPSAPRVLVQFGGRRLGFEGDAHGRARNRRALPEHAQEFASRRQSLAESVEPTKRLRRRRVVRPRRLRVLPPPRADVLDIPRHLREFHPVVDRFRNQIAHVPPGAFRRSLHGVHHGDVLRVMRRDGEKRRVRFLHHRSRAFLQVRDAFEVGGFASLGGGVELGEARREGVGGFGRVLGPRKRLVAVFRVSLRDRDAVLLRALAKCGERLRRVSFGARELSRLLPSANFETFRAGDVREGRLERRNFRRARRHGRLRVLHRLDETLVLVTRGSRRGAKEPIERAFLMYEFEGARAAVLLLEMRCAGSVPAERIVQLVAERLAFILRVRERTSRGGFAVRLHILQERRAKRVERGFDARLRDGGVGEVRNGRRRRRRRRRLAVLVDVGLRLRLRLRLGFGIRRDGVPILV